MRLLVPFLNKLLAVPIIQTVIDIALARNKLLCAELLWMANRDQKTRKAWFSSTKSHTVENLRHFIQIDLSNTRQMKQIIKQFGWPGESLVGQNGC